MTHPTDLAAILARITALPVTPGAGMILASRDEILHAITGTQVAADTYVPTATPTICCEYCGSSPVAEELNGHPTLQFAVGTQTEADAACAAYVTVYRGWTITDTNACCGDCARLDFTQDAS